MSTNKNDSSDQGQQQDKKIAVCSAAGVGGLALPVAAANMAYLYKGPKLDETQNGMTCSHVRE